MKTVIYLIYTTTLVLALFTLPLVAKAQAGSSLLVNTFNDDTHTLTHTNTNAEQPINNRRTKSQVPYSALGDLPTSEADEQNPGLHRYQQQYRPYEKKL